MWGYDSFCWGFGWWWIFPVAMFTLFAICFLTMRGRTGFMCCRPSSRASGDSIWNGPSESAREILDKRYAAGEIGKEEYEDKKKDIDPTEG